MELNKSDDISDDRPVFNMGIAHLERLHKIMLFCNEASISGDLNGYYEGVGVLYVELDAHMNEEEVCMYKKLLKGCMRRKSNGGSLFNPDRIRLVDVFLRRVVSDKGLLMPSKDDPGMMMLK